MAIVGRDERQIEAGLGEDRREARAIARVPADGGDAVRPQRVKLRRRFGNRHHDLRVAMPLAQLGEQWRQHQRVAEQQVVRDENARGSCGADRREPRVAALASPRAMVPARARK